jgi:hypothetical protein
MFIILFTYSSFSVIKEGKEILNFIIEVFPSKVDYKSDYQEIIKDINAEISALAFEMIGKTYLTTKLKDTRTQTNVEYINILKVIFNDLEKDIKRICNSFKHNIQTIENIKSVEKSRATSRRTIDYIRKHPKTLLEAKAVRVLQDDLDDHIKFKEKNVMVVNVYNKNHLDKYLAHKFYHIPKKELSNVKLGVKYLAFYQSKKNFADEGGIKYYAKIDEVIEYKRSECSEIPYRPGKEDDIYLRFNLSKITTIKKIEPIQSARLISYTTLYLLKNASNMHMLNIKSSFEVKVYKKLYEISNKIGGKVKKEYNKYYLNNNLIELLENNKIRFNNKFIQYDKLEENILWKAENNL